VLKISSFVLMLLRCQLRAEDFQLLVDVVKMPACVEDFQLCADVVEMPASC
jgi:hypothetical protein